jgi:Mg2+-importing ATPase
VDDLNAQGFRVIALSYKEMPGASDKPVYAVKDESELILLGYLSFLDPPKESASEALKQLKDLSVDVKILTGDSEAITTYICKKVGLGVAAVLLGSQIEAMGDEELAKAVDTTNILPSWLQIKKAYYRSSSKAMKPCSRVYGDGINDAHALRKLLT